MIRAVLAYYGADLSGIHPERGWQSIRCPFHDDSHQSASVCPILEVFKCHACAATGSAATLIMWQEGLEYRAAVERAEEIARDFGEDVQPRSVPGNRLPGRTRSFSGSRKR